MNNKYLKVFMLSIQNSIVYRANFVAEIISGIIPFLVQVYIWINVYGAAGKKEIEGYQLSQLILYIAFSAIVAKLVQTNSHYDIANEIKQGSISQYIIKPLSFIPYCISKELGSRFIFSVILNVVLTIAIVVLNGGKYNILFFVFGFISCFLGMILYFMLNYNLALLSFWFIDVSQIFSATQLIFLFCSGGVVPVSFFPQVFQRILVYLPFPLIIYFPVNVFSGKENFGDIFQNMLIQIVWILILLLLSRLLWKKGVKKFSFFGG